MPLPLGALTGMMPGLLAPPYGMSMPMVGSVLPGGMMPLPQMPGLMPLTGGGGGGMMPMPLALQHQLMMAGAGGGMPLSLPSPMSLPSSLPSPLHMQLLQQQQQLQLLEQQQALLAASYARRSGGGGGEELGDAAAAAASAPLRGGAPWSTREVEDTLALIRAKCAAGTSLHAAAAEVATRLGRTAAGVRQKYIACTEGGEGGDLLEGSPHTWSEADTITLVVAMRTRLQSGMILAEAVREVAAALGRSWQSVESKWRREIMRTTAGSSSTSVAAYGASPLSPHSSFMPSTTSMMTPGQLAAAAAAAAAADHAPAVGMARPPPPPPPLPLRPYGKTAPGLGALLGASGMLQASDVDREAAQHLAAAGEEDDGEADGEVASTRGAHWSPEQFEQLKAAMKPRLAAGMSAARAALEVAPLMGRSLAAVKSKWRCLLDGMTADGPPAHEMPAGRRMPWTEPEVQVLVSTMEMRTLPEVGGTTVIAALREVAMMLQRTYRSVEQKWRELVRSNPIAAATAAARR